MKKLLLVVLIAFGSIFSGCAQTVLDINVSSAKQYKLEYAKVKVKDFALEKDIKVNDVIWVNGYVPIHKGLKPSLHEILHTKLTKAFQPDDAKNSSIEIAILDNGLFMEKNFADDLVFVQFFRIGADRDFKCTATFNIDTHEKQERITLEHNLTRKYFQDNDEAALFISSCQDSIIEKLYQYISREFASKGK